MLTAVWRSDMIAEALADRNLEAIVVDVDSIRYTHHKTHRETGVRHHFKTPPPALAPRGRVVVADTHEVDDMVAAFRASSADALVSIFCPFYGGEQVWPFYRDAAVVERLQAEGMRALGHTQDVIERTVDKAKFREWCVAHGFPVSPGVTVNSLSEAEVAFERLGPGAKFLKPATSAGGVGIARIETIQDLRRAFHEPRTMVLEAEVTGLEISVEVLVHQGMADYICPIYKGRTGPEHPARRTKIAPAPLPPGVVDEICSLAVAVCTTIGGAGVCELDLIYTDDGRPIILEANPRPSGSTRIGYWATGINIYAEMFDMAFRQWNGVARRKMGVAALLPLTRPLIADEAGQLLACPGVVDVVEHAPDLTYPDNLPRIGIVADDFSQLLNYEERIAAIVPTRGELRDLVAVRG